MADEQTQAYRRDLLYRARDGCLCGLAKEMWDEGAKGYADRHLEETGRQADGWEILYAWSATGAEWVMDFPLSEEHGGGPARLRRNA